MKPIVRILVLCQIVFTISSQPVDDSIGLASHREGSDAFDKSFGIERSRLVGTQSQGEADQASATHSHAPAVASNHENAFAAHTVTDSHQQAVNRERLHPLTDVVGVRKSRNELLERLKSSQERVHAPETPDAVTEELNQHAVARLPSTHWTRPLGVDDKMRGSQQAGEGEPSEGLQDSLEEPINNLLHHACGGPAAVERSCGPRGVQFSRQACYTIEGCCAQAGFLASCLGPICALQQVAPLVRINKGDFHRPWQEQCDDMDVGEVFPGMLFEDATGEEGAATAALVGGGGAPDLLAGAECSPEQLAGQGCHVEWLRRCIEVMRPDAMPAQGDGKVVSLADGETSGHHPDVDEKMCCTLTSEAQQCMGEQCFGKYLEGVMLAGAASKTVQTALQNWMARCPEVEWNSEQAQEGTLKVAQFAKGLAVMGQRARDAFFPYFVQSQPTKADVPETPAPNARESSAGGASESLRDDDYDDFDDDDFSLEGGEAAAPPAPLSVPVLASIGGGVLLVGILAGITFRPSARRLFSSRPNESRAARAQDRPLTEFLDEVGPAESQSPGGRHESYQALSTPRGP